MYPDSFDAKNNSCIKLGSSSAAGKFSFTVPDEVIQVIIYVAGYKANTAKITVNGQSYTISSLSNNGAYTAIEVDTTSTKTVTFTTVSGGYRAMVNTIVFRSMDEYDCDHQYEENRVEAKCTVDGSITNTCSKCGKTKVTVIPATDHSYDDGVVTPPTCVGEGYTTYTCVNNCGHSYTGHTTEATGEHNFVDGKCTVCKQEEGHTHSYTSKVTAPTCVAAGFTTYTCACGDTYTDNETEATGIHTYENGKCSVCNAADPDAAPTVVLELTKADFNTTSYAANNNTKTKNGYSYTSYQVMQQNSTMQWQKSKGYITIASNEFVKLEIKSTAGTFTVSVGGKTITATTANGVNTYDLSGLSGEVKISVGSATGNVDYIKFYA